MQVLDFSPMKLSLNTCVNLLALNGKCVPLRPNARMHSFKANSDLLISAPSIPGNEDDNTRIKVISRRVTTRVTHEFVCWRKTCRLLSRFRRDRSTRIFRELYGWPVYGL